MNSTAKQVVKFLIGGVAGSAVMFAFYYLLLALGVNYAVAYAVGFILSIVAAFFINKYYIFKPSQSKAQAAASFVKSGVIYAIAFFVSESVLILLVQRLGVSDKIAPLLSALLTTPLNFLLSKYWAFRG